MSWFKVCDSFHDHPKVEDLEDRYSRIADSCIALWTKAGSFCGDQLTNGVVTRSRLAKFGYSKARAKKLANALVDVGLWELHGNGYLFHDWGDYNPLKAEVEAQRAGNAKRQREYKAKKRREKALSSAVGTHAGNALPNAGTHSDNKDTPTRPDPTRSHSSECEGQARTAGDRYHDDPKAQAMAEALAAHPDLRLLDPSRYAEKLLGRWGKHNVPMAVKAIKDAGDALTDGYTADAAWGKVRTFFDAAPGRARRERAGYASEAPRMAHGTYQQKNTPPGEKKAWRKEQRP